MYTPDQYREALVRLFPRGDVWPSGTRGDQPGWDALLDALAEELGRFDVNEDQLLIEAYPDSATDAGGGLPAWERVLGLPRACVAGLSFSEDERRAAVRATLLGSRPVTLADFQAIAETFNRNAVVSEGGTSDLFRMSLGAMGDALGGDAFATAVTITYDGPELELLQCTLRHALPIHLTPVFVVV